MLLADVTSFNGEKVIFAYSPLPFMMLKWSPATSESCAFGLRRKRYVVLTPRSSLPPELHAMLTFPEGPHYMPGLALRASHMLLLIIPTLLQGRNRYLRWTQWKAVPRTPRVPAGGDSAANGTQKGFRLEVSKPQVILWWGTVPCLVRC